MIVEQRINERGCPGCNGEIAYSGSATTGTCKGCGGLISTGIYLGDSFTLVKSQYHPDANFPMDKARYFDLTCVGSAGVVRRHGWYDPKTRQVVQEG